MKSDNTKRTPQPAARMVEDEAIEKLKKRARDMGLIVNAGFGKTAKQTGKKKGVGK